MRSMSSKKDSAKTVEKLAPKHIAIIMDGNGRWAKARHLPRSSGHQKGVQTVRKIVKHCNSLGIQVIPQINLLGHQSTIIRDQNGIAVKTKMRPLFYDYIRAWGFPLCLPFSPLPLRSFSIYPCSILHRALLLRLLHCSSLFSHRPD